MLDVPIGEGNSDSQDLNRTIETLVRRHGLSLAEAMEMVVPPIVDEIAGLPSRSSTPSTCTCARRWGRYAQGPVALIARHQDECVFSADAMGLRPLWQLETNHDFIFSSEPGVVSVDGDDLRAEADGTGREVPCADRPGAASARRSIRTPRCSARPRELAGEEPAPTRSRHTTAHCETGGPLEGPEIPGYTDAGPRTPSRSRTACSPGSAGSATTSSSSSRWPTTAPSRSAPSATTALSQRSHPSGRTSPTTSRRRSPWSPIPAIDREREIEHFSTRAVFGRRPAARRSLSKTPRPSRPTSR